ISLPTYPFAKERYWIDTTDNGQFTATGTTRLHPLLHSNTSDLSRQSYSSSFTGDEFFFAGHQVKGQKVLPAVVYLEMARAAIDHATPTQPESTILTLHNIVWAQPIVVTENKQVTIALYANALLENGREQIDYEITSTEAEQETVHCQGKALFSNKPLPAKLDIAQLQGQMQQGKLEPSDLYSALTKMGIHYGDSHQGIRAIHQGEQQLLTQLSLPAAVETKQNDYLLHPGLMDAALQASMVLSEEAILQPTLPFSLEILEIIHPCRESMWAWVRYVQGSLTSDKVEKLDIDLCDDDGRICVSLRGLSSRALEEKISNNPSESPTFSPPASVLRPQTGTLMLKPDGKENTADKVLEDKTLQQLKILFGETIKLAVSKIDAEESWENYGLDSIMITQLNQQLSHIFGEISKTLFFEYANLRRLTRYLINDNPQACMDWTGLTEKGLSTLEKTTTEFALKDPFPPLVSLKKTLSRHRTSLADKPNRPEPIAIIGLSGRYPQADTLEAYWQNIKAGKDCITEIPEARWSLQGFFHADQQEAVAQGKSYSKWGGFLHGFADFDPLFFHISPREARNMDPQERLFIETCWATFEDAGYTKTELTQNHKRQVGIFVGITKTGYNLYGPELWQQGEQVYPHTSFGSVANRISYLLDLQGPSMPIDTMCSASLTAIHEACEHIHRQECEMAIAGGVNLYLHPSSYIELCAQQMLSSDGRCKSFGQGGNGFVPGEGVGAVLLKPLSQAEKDQDHIYAVIRGTSINHGGKTHGYTVPNPTAQGQLIRKVLNKAGVDARTLSYIEAHGTGTALGDPIEITGLKQAFEQDTQVKQYCAIGSVKSNIGHLEAAAGIAGVTKILLQFKHQQLAPSLHADRLNPDIDFKQSPFIVQRELKDWKRPTIQLNGQSKNPPRIAGISSFGAGGANAHIILEEYYQRTEHSKQRTEALGPTLLVLSAKTEERLKAIANNLNAYLTNNDERTTDRLRAIAYTLQVGREAMEERLAVIVTSYEDMQEKLQAYLQGKEDIEDVYRGQVKRNKDTL
ncbi:MAG: beta-ketoacyl synthase N-terminal-like domain-containing protein, partial [Pseudomonadales bacterium]